MIPLQDRKRLVIYYLATIKHKGNDLALSDLLDAIEASDAEEERKEEAKKFVQTFPTTPRKELWQIVTMRI